MPQMMHGDKIVPTHKQHLVARPRQRERHPNITLGPFTRDEEDPSRKWQEGMKDVPAVYRALIAELEWDYASPPPPFPPPRWSGKLDRDLRYFVIGKKVRTHDIQAWRDYVRARKIPSKWLESGFAFRAPFAFEDEGVRDLNTLKLWPTEVANLRLPPTLWDDPDVLAIQAWCSGIRGEFRWRFRVDVTTASMRRGMQKICNDVHVQVALAAPFVRYLGAVRIKPSSMVDNIRAVEKTMRSPMTMKQHEAQAWRESTALAPALREAVALRDGRKLSRTMHGRRPTSWMEGWRWNNLSLIEGVRFPREEE